MNKRKLIKKLSLPAGIVAVISTIGLLLQIPIQNARYENHLSEFKEYFNSFTDSNKAYLKGISGKIISAPPDPILINELQSEYMIDHQKSGEAKKYLWMSDMNGNFIFGVPPEDFQRMNDGFDKYKDIITADNFFSDRNDFLLSVIDKNEKVNFSRFDAEGRPSVRYRGRGSWFNIEEQNWGLIQPTSTSFSAPVFDNNGKLIAELYMKVDDNANAEKYLNENRMDPGTFNSALQIVFIVLLSVSGAFLWFLLPTWVYLDAQQRDVKTPGIWAFLTLTSLFFGLTIYLMTRPATLKSFNCPNCDGELNGTRAYCPHCGYDLSKTFCQQCQYPIKPEWQFCPNCRAETKLKEPPQPVKNVQATNEEGNI